MCDDNDEDNNNDDDDDDDDDGEEGGFIINSLSRSLPAAAAVFFNLRKSFALMFLFESFESFFPFTAGCAL